jgi:hypothetical protein
MSTQQPSVTRNEAAATLEERFGDLNGWEHGDLLVAALSEERRLTVERITEWFERYAKPGGKASVWSYEGKRGDSLEAILDEIDEASR